MKSRILLTSIIYALFLVVFVCMAMIARWAHA